MATSYGMNVFRKANVLFPSLQKFCPWSSYIKNYSTLVAENTELCESEPDKLYKIMELEMRGNDPAVLRSYSKFLNMAASELGIEVGRSWNLRKPQHDRLTLLRSIHVNKKCRVQYEMRTYFSFVQLNKMTGSTCDTYLEYVQRNLPEGVALKVTRVALEGIPDHIKPPDLSET